MRILIINGPNLNLLGKREPDIYGSIDFDTYHAQLCKDMPDVTIDYLQSNHEGEIIDMLQENGFGSYNGIVINPGGFTHYSVAIADAIAAIDTPVVEVHISNIFSRESYRHSTVTGSRCAGVLAGMGLDGYRLAIEYFK